MVAEEDLQRHQHGEEPQRHRQHDPAFLREPPTPHQIGADTQHDEARGDEERHHRVREPGGKGRIEDDLQPVGREEASVDDLVAGRRLHPAVGRQDPERREQRAERHHQRCNEMGPGRHQLAPEQQHAEKRRLEKKCRQALVGEQRRQDIGGGVRIAAPVGAELERHDDAGDHAHPEGDRENPDPEHRDAKIDVAPGERLSPSSTAMKAARPTVKAGSRMCQPMTQANCNRDRKTGSRSIAYPQHQPLITAAICAA